MEGQASQSSPFCQVITSDEKYDERFHLFDISLSALGVTWCWGVIGWFWILSYGSRLRWMWLVLILSTYHHHHHHHHFPPIFTLGSLQCCLNENASRALTQEKGIIGYKGVLPVWKWSCERGVECLPNRWQEKFVQEVSPVCLHWSGEGQDTL